MNRRLITTAGFFLMLVSVLKAQAPMDSVAATDISQNQVVGSDASLLESVDYANIKLPPLGTLFENAKSTPSIELLEKERQLAQKLLSKEKMAFLSFFRVHGSYSYGNTSSTSTSTDVMTPIFSIANGYESSYWNVGASVNVGLESLWDLNGRVNRQRLEVEKASVQKEVAFDELRQQIATIYVRITNNLVALKTASENAVAYRGASLMIEQRFRNNQATIQELAEVRRYENESVQTYQSIQAQISTDIVLLEIMTHTPIITNITTE